MEERLHRPSIFPPQAPNQPRGTVVVHFPHWLLQELRDLGYTPNRHNVEKTGWDEELYCSPGAVSAQERVQIQPRLDGWAHALVVSTSVSNPFQTYRRALLQNSAYTLPDLPLPLRPLWITRGRRLSPGHTQIRSNGAQRLPALALRPRRT